MDGQNGFEASQQGGRPLSNGERKRQAREKLLVEQRRAEKVNSGHVTAHRVEEIYWKSRSTEPGWNSAFTAESECIEWATPEDATATGGIQQGLWRDRNAINWPIRRRTLDNGKQALLFSDRPGLIFLSNYLDLPEQRSLIAACLHETTGPASRTNLDTHYVPPSQGWWRAFDDNPESIVPPRHEQTTNDGKENRRPNETDVKDSKRVQVDLPPMNKGSFEKDVQENLEKKEPLPSDSVQPAARKDLIRKMRWTILGLEYHWGTKSYKWDKPHMPMPSLITNISQSIVQSIPWSAVFGSSSSSFATTPVEYSSWSTSYRPEAGVVNFYQYRDSLTAHVDQSEVDTVKPLVSISLGESAIFLVGGENREDRPIPLLLKSGDVVVMSGQSRRVFHGVPRIIEGSMKDGLLEEEGWEEWEDGMKIWDFVKGTRININVRHVFSEG